MMESKEVFLSYGRDPERVDPFVTQLKSDLEAAGISVWRDKDDIQPGSNWPNEIGVGVYDCRALLCVLTKKHVSDSDNCKRELDLAFTEKKMIFPVLYETITWDKNENSKGVSFVLRTINWADFRPDKVDYEEALRSLVTAMKERGLGQGGRQGEGQNWAYGRQHSQTLSQKVTDPPNEHRHVMLFRKYVSRKAANKGIAVLEGVGLDAPTIATCFSAYQREEEAVQEGLTKWRGGKGFQPPTWGVLIDAIEYAQIEQQAIDGLKKELSLYQLSVSPILQAAYKEALDKHGSVSVDITQCLFIGASATGKSTLKHLLVHNTPKAVKTSTAVMATPEVVNITSEHYAVEKGGTSAWQLVSNDVMGKSLRECITTRAFDRNTQYPSEAEVNRREQAKQDSSTLEQGDALSRSPQATPVHQQQHSTSTRTQAGAIKGSLAQVSPIAILDSQHSQLLQEMGGDGERIQLHNASFIHLLDTGGQPSFQDALPLLLDVPCTYIQVFNTAQDLDQRVPITYRRDDHTEESLPPSTETGWEMMLRSFSSMHTMAHKKSKELDTFQQERDQLPQLRIFVVGTFKDQLVEEGRCESVVQNICSQLRRLTGKPYYQSFKWNGNQPFYLINGLSVAGEEGVCINNLRKHLSSEGSALKLNVPVMWYVCQQITQRAPLKFFKFNDLKDFCLKHQFIEANNADSQFRSLLKLFSLLGFYAFFNLKDVPDESHFVCTDRGVFLKEVSKLLAAQFAAARSPAMERLKETGILVYNPELFQELGISQEMDLHWFLNSLCYLGIAARLSTKERAEYFIPAVLPQKAVRQTPSGSVVPLCFTYRIKKGPVFAYNDLPQGLFCRLAVDLIRQEWKIIENQSTRTLLKFRWKEFEIFLQECPGYISLIPRVVEEFPSVSELHAGCEGIYHTVTVCLSHSTEDALGSHFSTVAELVVGFECPCNDVNIPHLALPSSTGKSLTCNGTSSCQVYTKQQRIWFSTVDGATLKFFEYNKFWSLEDSVCRKRLPEASDAILSQMVYERPGYLMLFRKHVSRKAADKGRAVLEGVGLDATTIQTCFEDNPHKIEEVVQNGLTKWSEGQGLPPTWQVLCESMEYAEIGQQHIQSLKTALGHRTQ